MGSKRPLATAGTKVGFGHVADEIEALGRGIRLRMMGVARKFQFDTTIKRKKAHRFGGLFFEIF
jgi:hypothetical protein